jgi:hypothetical protein
MQLIIGIIIGFCIATYGIGGVANALDKGIEQVKNVKITTEK